MSFVQHSSLHRPSTERQNDHCISFAKIVLIANKSHRSFVEICQLFLISKAKTFVAKKFGKVVNLLLTVRGHINFFWQFSDVDLEPFLHIIENFGVLLVRHKSDSQTLGSKPTSSGHLEASKET